MPLDQVSGELDRVEAALVSLPGHREERVYTQKARKNLLPH